MHRVPVVVLTAITAALLATSACATPAPAPGDPAAARAVLDQVNAHNAADVTFVRDMIPHHEQGIELSALVPARSTNGAVRDLAALIDRQQGYEISQLRGVLTAWNVPRPDGMSGMAGMDMAGMGMASPDTLARLRDLRGPEFDRLWLQTMIRHHEGAVTMARTELDAGMQRGARNIASNTISVQQRQIDDMRAMLAS